MLRLAVGNEHRREHLTKRRIAATPSEFDELEHRVGFIDVPWRWIAFHPATREGAVKDEVAYALGMTRGIGDRQTASLTAAKKNEMLEPGGVHHRFEVAQAAVESKAFHVSIGKAAAAAIVPCQ